MPRKRSDCRAAEASRSSKRLKEKAIAQEEFVLQISDAEDEAPEVNQQPVDLPAAYRVRRPQRLENQEPSIFVAKPIDFAVAKRRWPHRYLRQQTQGDEAESSTRQVEKTQARRHYTKALIDGRLFLAIGDDAHVKADEGEDDYICRIIEMFEGVDGESYFTAQWFFRAKDTVIKDCSNLIDDKRVFLSTIKDDNNLDCLVRHITIVRLPLIADDYTRRATLQYCDYYYDMLYHVSFSTFLNSYHGIYSDGKVCHVLAAVAFLKDTLDKEGIQELITNLSIYKEETLKLCIGEEDINQGRNQLGALAGTPQC